MVVLAVHWKWKSGAMKSDEAEFTTGGKLLLPNIWALKLVKLELEPSSARFHLADVAEWGKL